MSKPLEITLPHKLGFLFIHFSSSTDDMLSARELEIISNKVDYFISPEAHLYRKTYHILTDVLNWYMTLSFEDREREFLKFTGELKSELQENNKTDYLNSLQTLAEADGVNTKEVFLIDKIRSLWDIK